jgi:hypothetical protein
LRILTLVVLTAGLALAAGCSSDSDEAPRYVLTPGAAFHGSMTPAQPVQAADVSAPQAVTATADEGFVFAGWTAVPAGNAAFADASLASTQVILSADATVTPTFMVAAAQYFVNQRLGSDTAAGTSAALAFKTLTRALAVAGAVKALDPTVAVAPGAYDAANGEVFPLIVPAGVTLLGDEANRGQGTTVQGAGAMPGWDAIQVALIPSTNATVAGLHVLASGRYSLAYDLPSGGSNIVLRNNTIEPGWSGGLYVQVAAGGSIADNVWTGGTTMTLVAVGGDGTTAVEGNVFNGPVELDDNHLDLGGGAGMSPGGNQLIGTGMSYFGGPGIMARNNHWNHAPPTVAPAYAEGASDYDMYLQGENTTVDATGYY